MRLCARGKFQLADLGNALDNVSDLFAKLGFNLVHRNLGVFDRVVQQAGDNSSGVKTHFRQDRGYLKRMY